MKSVRSSSQIISDVLGIIKLSSAWAFSLCLRTRTWLRHQDLPNCCTHRLLRHTFLSLCSKLATWLWLKSFCMSLFPWSYRLRIARQRGSHWDCLQSSRIVRPCCLVDRCERFGRTPCLHFYDRRVIVTSRSLADTDVSKESPDFHRRCRRVRRLTGIRKCLGLPSSGQNMVLWHVNPLLDYAT
jgi:hypothetical protein